MLLISVFFVSDGAEGPREESSTIFAPIETKIPLRLNLSKFLFSPGEERGKKFLKQKLKMFCFIKRLASRKEKFGR